MTITSPQGTVVVLTTDNGGAATLQAFAGTVWDDQADVPVTEVEFDIGTRVRAAVPEGALGAFRGEDPNGEWTLTIVTDSPLAGTLNGWSLELATLSGEPATTLFSVGTHLAQAIPDGDQAGVVLDVPVTGVGSLVKLRLFTSIAHDAPGQLEMFLTSPAGTTATITTGNGAADASALANTLWSDVGPTPVTDAVPPFTTVVPEEAMSAFLGEDGSGTWRLTLLDRVAGGIGTLTSATLETTFAFNWNLATAFKGPRPHHRAVRSVIPRR